MGLLEADTVVLQERRNYLFRDGGGDTVTVRNTVPTDPAIKVKKKNRVNFPQNTGIKGKVYCIV